MKKGAKGRHFTHKGSDKALLRNLVTALLLKEKLKTTLAKAKEVAPLAEKLITRAKKNDLASLRLLQSFVSKPVVEKLRKDLGPRYQKRAGGYTRIVHLGQRLSDGAKMAFIELVKSHEKES